MDKNAEILKSYGLTDEEASVYLASLSLGPTTVLKIANTSGIKRTNVYRVIRALSIKGLMRTELKGLKRLFAPENPANLRLALEQKASQLNELLPNLLNLFNKQGKDTLIKYYEGVEGVKSVYEGLLRDTKIGDPYYIISSHREWYQLDTKWFEDFTKRRNDANREFKFFLLDSAPARRLKEREQNYTYRVKILPKNTDFSSIILITPNRVVIHSVEPPIEALVIENQDTIKMFLQIFRLMWASIPDAS